MAAYDNIRDLRDDTRDQLRELRRQVDDLMEERVTPMLSDAANRASKVAKRARSMAEDQGEVVAGRVRDQPLIAVGVAAAVGYLLGRITR